jgi:peptidoglycan/LPS O-acetylase OafA/YrhL
MFNNQDRMAEFATLFGAMLLAIAISLGAFMIRGFVPPFILVVLPAVVGAGLLAAGLVHKRDNGWTHNPIPPERRA